MPGIRTDALNALVVVDVQQSSEGRTAPNIDAIAARIHQFVGIHEDEYIVIVATKRTVDAKFNRYLRAIPDTIDQYAATNVDFDAVFYGDESASRIETLSAYLTRHKIGHVDIVGFSVAPIALLLRTLLFDTTVLSSLCAGEMDTIELLYRKVKIER